MVLHDVDKKKIAIIRLTTCGTCQFELYKKSKEFEEILKHLDLSYPKKNELEERYDVILIEGGIANKGEEDLVKDLGKRSDTIIAVGSCACFGGIPSYEDFFGIDIPFNPPWRLKPVNSVVNVKYYIKGCPINIDELTYYIRSVIIKRKPFRKHFPVCAECRMSGTPCLLERGELCLGPITEAGCNAICTSSGKPCEGCRGPLDDRNMDYFLSVLDKYGIDMRDLETKYDRIGRTCTFSRSWKQIINSHCYDESVDNIELEEIYTTISPETATGLDLASCNNLKTVVYNILEENKDTLGVTVLLPATMGWITSFDTEKTVLDVISLLYKNIGKNASLYYDRMFGMNIPVIVREKRMAEDLNSFIAVLSKNNRISIVEAPASGKYLRAMIKRAITDC
ncbi:MAG: hypothetical protein EF806_06565 [Candidatus Methanoliparum thermophilum]|uniref:NADH:ubiquinone oxidoreductase-like 20kDa subunit domain-containing protein n=1 Tax=Methanoliparum thermophilum TaxID=2491083 RepID=A0A520KQR8_METT2|nr:hypothetical protein [Candidatus Methanoliparum sp. LAM-1]RZN63887.1 MAG: hypothetical protein EF806_06565 [Candidatus Methanoliparum thermophilum]BDC36383.1 hypothetical protein MTLP_10650 [Candidatus Methanoliparum sp. LAM-1]